LRLAGIWPESALDCNNAAWALVREPVRPEAIYQRGLRLAETACRLVPFSGSYLNTRGVAEYRLGRVAEALATLRQSNALNQGKEPADLAFLVMAHEHLGQSAEARAMLDRLRDVIHQAAPDLTQSDVRRALLAEAEALVLYDPLFPGDPFAP
jgi:tetratricopeptide (TPR) repeat protein